MPDTNVIPMPLRRARHVIAAEAAGVTLDLLQRSLLQLQEDLHPWSSSILIDRLVRCTDPAEREAIIRELGARR